MPSKNSIKQYLENGYYHVYNRGVEKRDIFLDGQDYSVFLSYLKEYLLPKNEKELYEKLTNPSLSYKERVNILKFLRLNNFNSDMLLIAFCLMPNHFHFFVKQKKPNSIDSFMNSLGTRYTMYFNKKYKRVGSLYQDVYKAVLVENENQFLHLSRYIHKQALGPKGDALRGQPSSYGRYLGQEKTEWVRPEEVLSFFSDKYPSLSYSTFVEESDEDHELIKNIILEKD